MLCIESMLGLFLERENGIDDIRFFFHENRGVYVCTHACVHVCVCYCGCVLLCVQGQIGVCVDMCECYMLMCLPSSFPTVLFS